MNTGEPRWVGLDEATVRVRAMQTKLHHWAVSDPDRLFEDVFNLVYDRDFLTVAWAGSKATRGPEQPVSTGTFRL